MKADDLVLISVDDHLVEPPDMFADHIPARYRELAPKIVRTRRGADVWSFDGGQIPNIGLNAVAGRPKEEYGIDPTAYDEMRPGCWDIHERIKDMNAGGVLASMCFPSFPGFSGRLFADVDDKDLALAVVRAYNDWHIDEWCGTYPGRFIPMAVPVLWDANLAADEVRRVAAKGVHSVTFTENPATLGYPSFHDEYWDPFWAACCDEAVVVSIHLGSSGKLAVTSDDAPVDVMITLQPMNICQAAADLVWSRVLKEFPSIRIALSEGGTGWIPYFLDRLDRTYDMHHRWTGQNFGDELPSDVFRRHFLTCFIADPIGIELRRHIGLDNMAWEMDYPHSDSSWPGAPEELAEVARDVPDEELAKISHENAARWYSFDPFAPAVEAGVHRGGAAGRVRRPRRSHPLVRQGPPRTAGGRREPRRAGQERHCLSAPRRGAFQASDMGCAVCGRFPPLPPVRRMPVNLQFMSDEDHQERVDRELIELLNELRVALPGVQVLFAFLLTVPFTQRFRSLSDSTVDVYFAAVALAATATLLLVAPAAHHRVRFRDGVKDQMLRTANALALLGTIFLALALAATMYVIADVVYGSGVARLAAALLAGGAALLWFVLPLALRRRQSRPDLPSPAPDHRASGDRRAGSDRRAPVTGGHSV